ncbi:hypothetical protein E1293_10930 [Actinomadura darangshiensis]|uniref:Uncharacterized protein n=1 Tax=Actinomadura darangshiensis TaxID=705336 RepID=A0A4R5BNQ7_9ACTN|nr:hypothetical protein [Actinomadura darangshiensis]TDD85612.1 hypothetical protein E1293_10930 [Actinomadura darangshiensis]
MGDYVGYRERLSTAVRRREIPSSDVVMVVAFGDPLHPLRLPRGAAGERYTCLVVALHDSVAVIEHSGLQHGVAIRLSPLRASPPTWPSGLPSHPVGRRVSRS